MVEGLERGDVAAASDSRTDPAGHANQLRRIKPGPRQVAMAATGLLDEICRLPLVLPKTTSKEQVLAVLKDLNILEKPAFV
jgi:hypothetical protein